MSPFSRKVPVGRHGRSFLWLGLLISSQTLSVLSSKKVGFLGQAI